MKDQNLNRKYNMKDLDYIKKFSKITVKDACKENGVNSSNLYAGRCSDDKVHLVRQCIEAKIAKLTIEDYFSSSKRLFF
jgi:hypothetical protein